MNKESFANLFPLGSHLCREPMPPMSEIKRDMEILKRQGFNLIKLQEQWAVDEPAEGEIDLSRYEELIEHAAGLDMGVYLGLTCEQAPAWLWRKYPDCAMVGRSGLPVAHVAQTPLPSDGKPGPCFDHPGACAAMVRFIEQLVRILGRYENIVVWNTWQEIGYWSESLVGQHVCYCPHTLAHYRRWLAETWGDLDALNRAWNARYAAWEDVSPDRGERVIPVAQEIAWRYFMDNVQIAQVLRVRAQAIRESDPLERPVFAHTGPPAIGPGRDWAYARCQDFLGASCYPVWSPFHSWDDGAPQPGQPVQRQEALRAEMWNGVALRYDHVASCNPAGQPVWAAEFQGGPVSGGLHKGRIPDAADIRRWMLTAIGSGVTGISFWVARAEIMAAEQNGFGLLDSVGDHTPRLAEAGRIGRALQAHADLFAAPTRPMASVAILSNEWNHQLCSVLAQGRETLPYSMRGWHRLLWDLGIPVDFVALDASDADLDSYKALILPFPLSISDELVLKLGAYVQQGGNLISEACLGRLDEQAYARRGEWSAAMADWCGLALESLTMVREPGETPRWSPVERTWGEYLAAARFRGMGLLAGHGMQANVYVETYHCTRGMPVLWHDERVTGVMGRHGQGTIWQLGTCVGHAGTAYRDQETGDCIRTLLAQCEVQPTHAGQCLLRKRVGRDKEAWILTNPHDRPITEHLDRRGWGQVIDLLDQPLYYLDDQVALTIDGLDVRVLILTR